jgi:hypothetical protein
MVVYAALLIATAVECVIGGNFAKTQAPLSVALLRPSNLRTIDNIAFEKAQLRAVERDCSAVAIYVDDPKFHRLENSVLIPSCVKDVEARMAAFGTPLVHLKGDSFNALVEFLSSTECHELQNVEVFFCNSPDGTIAAADENLEASLRETGIKVRKLPDRLTETSIPMNNIEEKRFKSFNKYYPSSSNFQKMQLPFSPSNYWAPGSYGGKTPLEYDTVSGRSLDNVVKGESLALQITQDYLILGEDGFTRKYFEAYSNGGDNSQFSSHAKSIDHARSLSRLGPNNVFAGEVLSALLAPLLSLGALSPRVLAYARTAMLPLLPSRPSRTLSTYIASSCPLLKEACRRDWHMQLALSEAVVPNVDGWEVQFTTFRGYLTRIGIKGSKKKISDAAKPIIVMVHGFGGSIMQFSDLADQLADEFTVVALDSLGFGASEKPPLSYNQVASIPQKSLLYSSLQTNMSISFPRKISICGGTRWLSFVSGCPT